MTEKLPAVEGIGVKHARLMEHENPKIKVRMVLWDDGAVTSCVELEDGKGFCYTSSPEQEPAFWAFIAALSDRGFKEHHIEPEK